MTVFLRTLSLALFLLRPPAVPAQDALAPSAPRVEPHARIVRKSVVFREGEAGYASFRIPVVLRSEKGTLLAFAEGRRAGRSDTGDIDLVLKRSFDEGRSWGPLQLVHDAGEDTIGNPCVAQDPRTKTLVLLACRNAGEDRESRILAGKSGTGRTVWVLRSRDDGASWSAPEDITASVKKDGWTWYATGPAPGIHLRRSPRPGRLVFPANHARIGERSHRSHLILSDDGGQTFRLGAIAPRPLVNEAAVAELPDGRLVLNMRNYDRTQPVRQVATSDDAGETLRDQRHEPTLPEPRCQAALLAPPPGTCRSPLLFSNPAHPKERRRLTVKHAREEGYEETVVLHEGPAAYSTLTPVRNALFGCFYECGESSPYERLEFCTFRLGGRLALEPRGRVGVIGASVSAGFSDPRRLWRNLTRPLATAMRPGWPEEEFSVEDVSTSSMYRNPRRYGPRQLARLPEDVDLVVALDYPFWFGYGYARDLATRKRLQADGLRTLEALSCPVLVGDYPDMRGADEIMLPPRLIPSSDQLVVLNDRLRRWVEEREDRLLFPLSSHVAHVRKEGYVIPWRGRRIRLESEQLLQSDRLHATRYGIATLAWRLHALLREELPLDHPARPAPATFEDFAQQMALRAALERKARALR